MLPEDQTVDVVCIDEQEHEYGVKLRNSRPVIEPQPELKLETMKKAELETQHETETVGKKGDAKPDVE